MMTKTSSWDTSFLKSLLSRWVAFKARSQHSIYPIPITYVSVQVLLYPSFQPDRAQLKSLPHHVNSFLVYIFWEKYFFSMPRATSWVIYYLFFKEWLKRSNKISHLNKFRLGTPKKIFTKLRIYFGLENLILKHLHFLILGLQHSFSALSYETKFFKCFVKSSNWEWCSQSHSNRLCCTLKSS